MNLGILFLTVIGIVLVAGLAIPNSFAQSNSIASYVVINEVDTNPPGDDAKTISEWIELYNPTNSEVNIGGWKIVPTTGLKKVLTIPEGTTIKPNQFKAFSYQNLWFTDISEKIELRDSKGTLVDETPLLSDLKNDFSSWQRIYDGYDTNSNTDWKFTTSTAGSSNGKLAVQQTTDGVSISIETSKSEYIFDETATISGKVSKQVFIEKPFFQAQQISLTVTGPNYFNTFTLYPDLTLGYKTTLNLQKVLGFSEGIYDVTVKYGDAESKTQFALGTKLVTQKETESSSLSISSDKESYLPGDTVKISAKTNKIIPLEGLKWSVIDPNGQKIYGGSLFPNSLGEFSTSFRLTTVSPVFGQNKITAEYATLKTESSFEITKDVKENKRISLQTDKAAYALGDKVIISGRLNQVWIPSLDFEMVQIGSGQKSIGVQDLLKILDSVRVAGDGTFSYEFQISNNIHRLGEYKVTVSKEIGSETIFFRIVEDPENYVKITEPFTINTNKQSYLIGDEIIISGKINEQKISTQFVSPVVNVSITKIGSGDITINTFKPSGNKATQAVYSFTAVPDLTGNYKIADKIQRSVFDPGTYEIVGTYADGKIKAKSTFSVSESSAIGDTSINVSLNKEIFGLGETLQLTGSISSISQGTGIKFTLVKPDGTIEQFGTLADNGKFSWSWQTPKSEKYQTQATNTRSVVTSNFGVYRLTVATDTKNAVLFFKVSQNPLTDTLEDKPLTITTDKPVYSAGEKVQVIGTAQKRVQGTQGLVVPDRVSVTVLSSDLKVLYQSSLSLDLGGKFQTTYDLPLTIFKAGTYKIKSTYLNYRAETVFEVTNDILKTSSDSLTLILDTDKTEYYPGDIVDITARPNKLVYLEKLDLGIPREEQTKINCGTFVCGQGVPIVTLRPDSTGSFSYQYKIPQKSDSIGKYVITISAEFGTFKKEITVVEKPPQVEQPSEIKSAERLVEKFNRITTAQIPIIVQSKSLNGTESSPRAIEGTLLTAERGQESNVNLKVSTSSGTCIIGPDKSCLVINSTRAPGTIYKIVSVDGVSYKIRYSGPDAMLEKFSILPESDSGIIPDSTWNVEILKQEQPSRFYYKITNINKE